MAVKLERTKTPGIYRRHVADCDGGRCDCAYVVVWKHRGSQHTATFRTLAEAREAKGKRDAGDTRPAPGAVCRLRAALAWQLPGSHGPRTRRAHAADLPARPRTLGDPALRGRRLEEIEPPDVPAFVRHLERAELRPASIRAILAPVKAMYATAVEDGAVRFNPTRGLRIADKREPDGQEARALTRAELTRLLRWRLLFELLAHTGLRISEAIGLTWADVELGDRPRLRVRRQDCRGEVGGLKSEHSRRDVPLSPGMARRLWAIGADRPGTVRVFTSPLGMPLAYGNLRRRVLVPAAREAGLSWATFHTFRHTCASLLFEAGRDVKQVASWLGHADPAFTLRTYVHLMDDGIGDADFLDAAVRVNPGSTRRVETAANLAAVESAETAD